MYFICDVLSLSISLGTDPDAVASVFFVAKIRFKAKAENHILITMSEPRAGE